jgi:hypothetical protein
MGDAEEFHPPAERNDGLTVLKFDRARGAEARHAETWRSSKKMRLSASIPRFGMS